MTTQQHDLCQYTEKLPLQAQISVSGSKAKASYDKLGSTMKIFYHQLEYVMPKTAL